MLRRTLLVAVAWMISTSCVSKKIYTELETKYADLKKENRQLADDILSLQTQKNGLEVKNGTLEAQIALLQKDKIQLQSELNAAATNYKNLQEAYNDLEKILSESSEANLKKNKELLTQLEAKEKALAKEQDKLNQLTKALQDRTTRITELEKLIDKKDASMKKLKETLSKSLKAFEGKGLSVTQKNGNVYVSMENKLLFESGSYNVGVEGKKAVQAVASILAENPDIAVMIEGHTDNDPYINAAGSFDNNWDLSTKRATSIVNVITENKAIKKENITAAGRSEFAPVATNNTAEGKAKNRRIEIVLTPKLDEISQLLNEL